MLVMSSDIRIGVYRAMRPSEVTWECSLGSFTDRCRVTLPLSSYVETTVPPTDGGTDMRRDTVRVSSVTECLFREGDAVDVRLGYGGENGRVFAGFVKSVVMGEALTLECEGYSWQLRDAKFRRAYRSTTVRQILADLTEGTDIRLSDRIDDIEIKEVTFNTATKLQVLEWLQKECACRVFFHFDTLYAGASQYSIDNGGISIRLGWNTVSADGLKKDTSESVQINLVEKDDKGTVRRVKSEGRRYGEVREVKVRHGLQNDYLRRVVKEMQDDEDAKGYEGEVTLFMQPPALKGMVCDVTDPRFPERGGQYFIEGVRGSFGSGGGRQTIRLKNYGRIQKN